MDKSRLASAGSSPSFVPLVVLSLLVAGENEAAQCGAGVAGVTGVSCWSDRRKSRKDED